LGGIGGPFKGQFRPGDSKNFRRDFLFPEYMLAQWIPLKWELEYLALMEPRRLGLEGVVANYIRFGNWRRMLKMELGRV